MRYGKLLIASLALCFAAMTVAPAAFAEEDQAPMKRTGFYFGGGLGAAFWDSPVSDDSFAWRVQTAWRPHENFALEIGWLDPGETSSGATRTSLDGFTLVAAPMLPVGPITLLGKIGGYAWDADTRGGISAGSDIDLLYGAGVLFPLTEEIAIRLDYDRLDLPSSIDVVTLGLHMRLPWL